ncbi:MAG: Gfo/Idh/MocA family oxidoreductase [Kiritimatiellae bacterium]|nr:Gfo/Idh/MocA family oxidoreductase [Kiritimatiellia bacterium]MDD5519845.1 Gfo/Idh/MocA family oxidoreductase [Kiritimatiellia bacterium]
MNRRSFLAASTVTAITTFLPRQTLGQTSPSSPNEKLNHACIGIGGMGGSDLSNIKSHERTQIVAICDVDKALLTKAAAKLPGVRTYTDWRELLANESNKIDSVNVSVPDHMHTIIATSAMRAGKHVYCQKPLCHDMAECRLLRDTAKEKGVITQLGIQHSAGVYDRMTVQLLKDNAIGTVEHVYLFSNREGISRIEVTRPKEADPIPESLNWDLWLGTAPQRPYAAKIYHPRIWRIWQDFGSAWVGDIGCHIHSSVWKGTGLTVPISVKAEVQESWKNTPARFNDTWPQGAHITWIYPGNEKTGGKPLTVEWFDGMTGKAAANLLPPPEICELAKEVGLKQLPLEGSVVAGSEGWLMSQLSSAAPRLIMRNKSAAKPPMPKLPPWPNHYHEFLNSCLEKKKSSADFSVIAPMVEAVLLGNVAERVPDTLLNWDAPNMQITNVPAANKFLRRTYRKGWELPGLT